MTKVIVILAVVVFVSACVQNMIGFGYAVLALSFISMLFPYAHALALIQCIGIISTAYVALKNIKYIRWKVLLPLLIPTLLIGSVFTVLSIKATGNWIFILLGLMLIFLALFFFLFSNKVHVQPTLLNGSIMGALSGFGSGLFGIAGPPAAIYLLASTKDTKEYIGGMNMIFLGMNVVAITLRILAGSLSVADIPLIGIGWAAVLLGTVTGLQILKRMPMELFRRLVYIFVGLNGIYIIVTHL